MRQSLLAGHLPAELRRADAHRQSCGLVRVAAHPERLAEAGQIPAQAVGLFGGHLANRNQEHERHGSQLSCVARPSVACDTLDMSTPTGHHALEHAALNQQLPAAAANRHRMSTEPAAERIGRILVAVEPAEQRALVERQVRAFRNAELRRLMRDVCVASRLLDMRRRRLERKIAAHALTRSLGMRYRRTPWPSATAIFFAIFAVWCSPARNLSTVRREMHAQRATSTVDHPIAAMSSRIRATL